MSIGPDIKEVFEELGMPLILHKIDGTTVTGEYMDYDDTFHDSTTELQRQFALTVSFSYDSQAAAGDIIQLLGREMYYILISLKDDFFENAPVTLEGYLLRCNQLGRFARLTSTRIDYDLTETWNTTVNNVHALYYERGANTDAVDFQTLMEVPVGTKVLYIPAYSNVRVGDRWYPDLDDNTEYYRIATLHKRRFTGCLICYLVEDTRE